MDYLQHRRTRKRWLKPLEVIWTVGNGSGGAQHSSACAVGQLWVTATAASPSTKDPPSLHSPLPTAKLPSTDVYRNSIGALVVQIREMMQSEFSSCVVSVCNRNYNKVADSLATHGVYVLESGSCVYMSDVPLYVMDIVSGDLPLHRV